MSDRSVAFFIAFVFLTTLVTPAHYSTPQGVVNPLDCSTIYGTVVGKTQDETGNILYVDLDYKNEIRGYRVYVSPESYQEFNINETYHEKICNTWDYDVGVENLINNLTAWGIVELLS